MRTTHLLLTRFNVRRDAGPHELGNSVAWLRERLSIFSRVTLPAVMAQARSPDRWLVFFDEGTPGAIRSEMAAVVRDCPFLTPVYTGLLDGPVIVRALRQVIPTDTDRVITTRLDSDDALHPQFIDAVRRFGDRHDEGSYFINLPCGLILANDRLYRKRDHSSPFISMSEPATELRSVWIDQHQRLRRHAHIHQVALRDAWIQYVHGGNLANQIRGVRVSPMSVAREVIPPALAPVLRVPSRTEVLLDNSAGLLARGASAVARRIRREWADARSGAAAHT